MNSVHSGFASYPDHASINHGQSSIWCRDLKGPNGHIKISKIKDSAYNMQQYIHGICMCQF